MKIKIFILLIIIVFYSLLNGFTFEIKQDGSGDFSEIQLGIDAAVANDTILVYPGIYYENIILNSSDITLASLYIINADSSYIANTIIDGDQSGSCVLAENVSGITVEGFTLQNGSGTYAYNTIVGGGVCILESDVTVVNNAISNNSTSYGGSVYSFESEAIIVNNIINNNRADSGAGCFFRNSEVILSGNLIFSNFSNRIAGGIAIISSDIIFDPENLNSVYLNYATRGNDFFLRNDVDIILDKFTIAEPTIDFIDRFEATYTFSCQSVAIEQVPQDLFVSTDGDNSNSGLSWDEPLKTISYANLLIDADEENPRTIHIADGIYSQSTNDEHFMINLKSYVSLIGESEAGTILDGENDIAGFAASNGEQKIVLKNFTVQNCRISSMSPFGFCFAILDEEWLRFSCYLENITVKDILPVGIDKSGYLLRFIDGEDIKLKNITLENNICNDALSFWTSNVTAENVIVRGTHFVDDEITSGVAIGIGRFSEDFPDDNPLIFKNLLLENNNASTLDGCWPMANFYLTNYAEAYVINGTFTDNYTSGADGRMLHVGLGANLHLINSIVHDNAVAPLIAIDDDTHVSVSHTLFTNGIDDVGAFGGATLDWQEGNIEGDPLLAGENAEYPYVLSAYSACIDAGTIDLPDGIILPEFDIVGNPRIYGDSIDMGAYEFQGEFQSTEPEEIILPKRTKISNYPNPFNLNSNSRGYATNIRLELVEEGKTELVIYNTKGQKIKDLSTNFLSMGKYNFHWDGKDNNGKKVSSGSYIIKLKQNDKLTVKKMMIVK